MRHRGEIRLIPSFVGLRSATGTAAWLAPRTTARAMGLGTEQQQPLTTQLFGSRELTLAVAVAMSSTPASRVRALQLGLLVDALDILAAVRGLRAGTLSTTGLVVAGGGAALFATLGVVALRENCSQASTLGHNLT